jgi:hypothetical protein
MIHWIAYMVSRGKVSLEAKRKIAFANGIWIDVYWMPDKSNIS